MNITLVIHGWTEKIQASKENWKESTQIHDDCNERYFALKIRSEIDTIMKEIQYAINQ